MGLFGTFKRTVARTRVAQEATQLLAAGNTPGAYKVVKAFLDSDERLNDVVTHFDAHPEEIRHIYWSMLEYSKGDIYRGHAVAVSTLLETDTLAYMLRATRGQVDPASAYQFVQQYFHTGASYFAPEREYRRLNGL